jgi:16S rRNA pseudouridine516 synthase
MLHSQGFGSRRECRVLVYSGRVTVAGELTEDPSAEFDVGELRFAVDGTEWCFREHATLMLHKPAGYECSRAPQFHAGVLELLPPPLRARGVQPVGRLDQDTTGLLLLTDDGALNHRLTSPRHHVAKTYRVTLKHPADATLCQRLLEGVQLHDEPAPSLAMNCVLLDDLTLRMTIDEGKYHQVKRMVAAAGNRVEALHREAVGSVVLPEDLAPGEWRWMSDPLG